nr:type II toxin-antitoxin system RelE/ParE family toxin [Catenovulum sediminis]
MRDLLEDPYLGEQKKGDLSFLRVCKFKMEKQLTLLGYSYEDGTVTLELIAFGSHAVMPAICGKIAVSYFVVAQR